jgi:hypothetical protein
MAEIDLTLKTTQVVIVCAFVILTIYFNFVLIRSSLDILFWATITSIPILGLKNSAAIISPYLANLNDIRKSYVLLFIVVFAKTILFEKNKMATSFTALVILYIILEKALKKSTLSNSLKICILISLITIIVSATLSSILEELKFMAKTFNITGLVNEKNIKYVNDLISPNIEKILKDLKGRNNFLPKLQKCGLNYENIKFNDLKNINASALSKSYNILLCLSTEYKKQFITIAKSSQPVVLKALKKILNFGESSLAAISLTMTFASTVYIMTKQSIQPMDVAYAFLSLIDNSGYLSYEFKEIVNSLITYYFQKILVTGLSTFLTFSLFSMNIIAIPTILSFMTVLIPGAPTYLIPFIGIFELIFLQKPYWYIIGFTIACNRVKIYCDGMIKLKVSLINSIKII